MLKLSDILRFIPTEYSRISNINFDFKNDII